LIRPPCQNWPEFFRCPTRSRFACDPVQVRPHPSRHRRAPLVVVAALVLAFAAFVVVFAVPWWSGRPFGGMLSDRGDRVSLVIPHGWIDATADDAGKVVTRDDSGDETDPHRLPDLEAGAWDPDKAVPGSQRVTVEILPTDGAPLGQLHDQHTAAVCAENENCRARRPAEPVTVDGQPAVSQFLTPALVTPVANWETVWVVTVLDGSTVVRFTGTSTDLRDAKDGGQLAIVLKTLRVHA
jgi:hypothetical protein